MGFGRGACGGAGDVGWPQAGGLVGAGACGVVSLPGVQVMLSILDAVVILGVSLAFAIGFAIFFWLTWPRS